MGLSKLIKKVNKAKSAINSLKGISSKLQSLNYDSVTDQLGEEAKKAQKYLQDSRKRDSNLLAANEKRLRLAKNPPQPQATELMYPLHDTLDNYLVFKARPRLREGDSNTAGSKARGNVSNGDNVFGGKKDAEGKPKPHSTEVMLYVPDFTTDSAVSFGEANFGLGQRQLDKFIENVKGDGFMTAISDTEGANAVVQQGINSFLNSLQGGIKNVREGRVANPMVEAMFEGISFRSFDFEYEFWPRSEEEAIMVNHIIYTFRTAMLPDTFGESVKGMKPNDDENYFNFPNIFDVEWEGPMSKHLDGFLPMVCTKCSVDHFNNGNNTTFANGAPISQTMSLSFQEIKLLTQESYQEISPLGNKKIKSMNSIGAGEERTQMENPDG